MELTSSLLRESNLRIIDVLSIAKTLDFTEDFIYSSGGQFMCLQKRQVYEPHEVSAWCYSCSSEHASVYFITTVNHIKGTFVYFWEAYSE